MISAGATDLFHRVCALALRDWLIVAVVVSITVALALIVRSLVRTLQSIAAAQKRIHQQQANIIGMLLKAGFRPANTLDWLDDGDGTRQLGEPAMTQYDWRKPE